MSRARPTRRAGRQHGALLLEIVLVVVLISVLWLLAIRTLFPLRGDAEGAQVLGTIGVMQSALGMRVAERVLRDGVAAAAALDGSNPVDLLATPPARYRGAFASLDPAVLDRGEWGFDEGRGVLVYRVRFPQYFRGERMDPPRLEWRVHALRVDGEVRAILLQPLTDGRWAVSEQVIGEG